MGAGREIEREIENRPVKVCEQKERKEQKVELQRKVLSKKELVRNKINWRLLYFLQKKNALPFYFWARGYR